MTEAGDVVHVYGVVPAGAVVHLPTPGIGGTSVRAVPVGEFTALVSMLDGRRFGVAVWREQAEDPEWLAPVAAQHHEVLAAVAADSDVVPFRLPALYADEERMRAALEADAPGLLRAMDRVHGQVEWGVQVFLTSDMEDQEASKPASGSDYLRMRSEQASRRERDRAGLRERVTAIHDALARAASRSVVNPPQHPALSGRREPMVLNSAHLVPRDRRDAFLAAVGEAHQNVATPGLRIEVSGPWPPYNFTGAEAEPTEAEPTEAEPTEAEPAR